jgi:hypothetical protein
VPWEALFRRRPAARHVELAQGIARAREESGHRIGDRMLGLADVALNEPAMANAVRVAANILKWQAQVRNPGSYGERRKIEADLGGRILHSHDISAMSMLDKARAIHYALEKAAEMTKRVPALPSEVEPLPAPTEPVQQPEKEGEPSAGTDLGPHCRAAFESDADSARGARP